MPIVLLLKKMPRSETLALSMTKPAVFLGAELEIS